MPPPLIIRHAPPLQPNLRRLATHLRTHDTDAEHHLWFALRNKRLGVKFRRQQVIGPYIVDFYCADIKLVVEADGSQHSSEQDSARDAFLNREGITVLRFWNNDILDNLDGVTQSIQDYISKCVTLHPHPAVSQPPSPLQGEGKIESNNHE